MRFVVVFLGLLEPLSNRISRSYKEVSQSQANMVALSRSDKHLSRNWHAPLDMQIGYKPCPWRDILLPSH